MMADSSHSLGFRYFLRSRVGMTALTMPLLVLAGTYIHTLHTDAEITRFVARYGDAMLQDNTTVSIGLARELESKGVEALPILEAMFRNSHGDAEIRRHMRVRATTMLHKVPSPRATDILIDRLQDEDDLVRCEAMTVLEYRCDARALDAVFAAFRRNSDTTEAITAAVAVGTLYRVSERKPRHILQTFLDIMEGEGLLLRKQAALEFFEQGCWAGQMPEDALRALPDIVAMIEKHPEHADQAYGAATSLTGQGFGGLPHTFKQPMTDEDFIALHNLTEDDDLRHRVVREIKEWMRQRGQN